MSHRGRFLIVQSVTLARVPLALAFAVILLGNPGTTVTIVLCTVLLALMELSDALDGQLARRLSVVSELGAMLDPYADSVSRITVYWALASVGLMTLSFIPLVMAIRDITVAYCRIVWTRSGQSVSAQWSGKVKAVVQGTGAFVFLCSPSLLPSMSPWLVPAMSWIVLLVTLASMIDYLSKTTLGRAA